MVDEPAGPFLKPSMQDSEGYARQIESHESGFYLTANNVAFIRILNAKPSDMAEPTPKHHSAMNHSQPGSLRDGAGDAPRVPL
ncbi:hypothetical protein Bxe_B1812 [Paraburkholderia xenovorans LB400]|jgi:hypothetical protein|uniref:Uncharacterized protein n=2 Tax=Paraburkholderia xenovorans TaxID=36873 RepID=Q13P33_PARXL|nr:hypothetical protein Bxe_B1812 [Paraburkholderia xenovorans LB400]